MSIRWLAGGEAVVEGATPAPRAEASPDTHRRRRGQRRRGLALFPRSWLKKVPRLATFAVQGDAHL